MALSPKEREKIIEEETLRFETRMNLHKKACAERPVRWPWVLLGIAAVLLLYSRIFCGGQSCFGGHFGHSGYTCHGMMLDNDDAAVKPGQPLPPKK